LKTSAQGSVVRGQQEQRLVILSEAKHLRTARVGFVEMLWEGHGFSRADQARPGKERALAPEGTGVTLKAPNY